MQVSLELLFRVHAEDSIILFQMIIKEAYHDTGSITLFSILYLVRSMTTQNAHLFKFVNHACTL